MSLCKMYKIDKIITSGDILIIKKAQTKAQWEQNVFIRTNGILTQEQICRNWRENMCNVITPFWVKKWLTFLDFTIENSASIYKFIM